MYELVDEAEAVLTYKESDLDDFLMIPMLIITSRDSMETSS